MDELIKIVNEYDYPSRLFDFNNDNELKFDNYRNLENHINEELFSKDLDSVKNGLSNVLYWGHYRAGYRNIRVGRFRDNITDIKLEQFQNLVLQNDYDCIAIKNIKMPEFSGLAFISKILMFLDPHKYVTLDSKIMKLSDKTNPNNPLSNIVFNERDTSIRISTNTQIHYNNWCKLCKKIAEENLNDKLPVDVERGFFKLVENNKIDLAKNIIAKQVINLF